tara:strand:+ start:4526 stop:7756 length:3231 start_codon:yes stop_codon:yes gene_type:complete
LKTEADLVFPIRKSQTLTEITALKNLQDEQLALANSSYALTLYYLSGGNEDPGFDVQDKVRPEDHDLRGWFSKAYGENYLEGLLNEFTLDIPVSVIKITADFETNSHGYGMRQLAINEYHLNNILTSAKRTKQRRDEASSYAKQLCMLAGRALLSGDPPTGDVFTVFHNSIKIWYQLNYPTTVLPDINKTLNGQNNVNEYTFFIMCALYDMHKQGTDGGNWKKDVIGITPTNPPSAEDIAFENIFDELDGISPSTRAAKAEEINAARALVAEKQKVVREMESATAINYTRPPTWSGYNEYTEYVGRRLQIDHDISLEKGDEIPRNKILSPYTTQITVNMKPKTVEYPELNTNFFWSSYNSYLAAKEEIKMAEDRVSVLLIEEEELQGGDLSYVTYHNESIWELLKLTRGPNAIGVVKNNVRLEEALYRAVAFKLGISVSFSGYHIQIPPLRGSNTVSPSNFVDVSQIILFYARALRGVTPKAYWVHNLSHRIVPIALNGGTGYEVFLYKADLKTGGVPTSAENRVTIARIEGDRDNSLSIIASYLPDVPIYTPGANEVLPRSIQDSYEAKVMEDKSVKQWFNNTQKSMYNYVYVAESAWQHGLDVQDDARIAAARLKIAGYPNSLTARAKMGEFLVVDSLENKKYFGVNSFSPNISHLHYAAGVNSVGHPLYVKNSDRQVFNAKNTLHASQLKVIAFPQSGTDKIIEWTKTVPAQIVELLNKVNSVSNSGWYEFRQAGSRNGIYGNQQTLEQQWPEYRDDSRFRTTDLLNKLEPLYKFLFNRTESLFLTQPKNIIEEAYLSLLFTKPPENAPEISYIMPYRNVDTFNGEFYDYMAILGALNYFNSYHLYTDTSSSNRSYPSWCMDYKLKQRVDIIVDSVLASSTPIIVYSAPMNDLQDISNIHQVLSNLKVLDGMTEMPVFDVPEFNVKWQGSRGSVVNPFMNSIGGFPEIPEKGLTASLTGKLQNNYGDVFYKTLLDTCVIQPHFMFDKNYSRSFLRIPVRTNGISGRVYGNRPSGNLSMESAAVDTTINRFVRGGNANLSTGVSLFIAATTSAIVGYQLIKGVRGTTRYRELPE